MAISPTDPVQSCVYRKEISQNAERTDGNVSQTAICGLLTEISGVNEHPSLQVPLAACQACCRSYRPSTTDPNTIVASLLVGLAEQIVQENGVPNCSVEQAKNLASWAEKCLPTVSYDEDDTRDLARATYQHLANIQVRDIARVLPIPDESKTPSRNIVRNWAVGVTTSPRRLPTLQLCVQSIQNAGWEKPVLFSDGEVEIPQSCSGLDSSSRQPAVGAFPNYVLSLTELYMRNPHADAYLMIQDDALFLPSPATRSYLEHVLWPCSGPYIASLYCSKKYNQMIAGWHRFPGNWVWGAVAFAFSKAAVVSILTTHHLFAHRSLPGRQGLSKIDVVIGRIATDLGIPIVFPSPSLVQHIGTTSTIWDHARAVNARYADRFIGDLIRLPE